MKLRPHVVAVATGVAMLAMLLVPPWRLRGDYYGYRPIFMRPFWADAVNGVVNVERGVIDYPRWLAPMAVVLIVGLLSRIWLRGNG